MTGTDDFDLQTFLPYLLNQAAEETSFRFQPAYRDRYGMLRTEWRVLVHLGRYGNMTAKEIGERARVHKTKISRAVAALQAKRFLVREEAAEDRRRANLLLTRAGKAAYADLAACAIAFDRRMTELLTPQDAIVLRRCLRHLADAE